MMRKCKNPFKKTECVTGLRRFFVVVVQAEEDVLIERDGAKVVVDQTSLDYLKGNKPRLG